ncbi:MAG: GNAT family N-acetyltransferase, partial [Bacteroidota bacterium]
MDKPPPFIRPAVFSDLPQIIRLCADHAAYERSDYQTYGKAEQLKGLLFGDAPAINCLVVEEQFGLIG